jgi:tetratricopeptide (TPR) repeat protein
MLRSFDQDSSPLAPHPAIGAFRATSLRPSSVMLRGLMVSRLRLVVSLLAIITVVAVPAYAQGRRGGGGGEQQPQEPPKWKGKADVSGKILDEAGKGVEAKITLVHAELKSGFFVMTKKNGEFQAKDMKAGEWKVMIEAPKYVTVVQTVQVTEAKNAPIEARLAIDKTPELIAKGEELFKAGQFAQARAEYQKVLEAHPEAAGDVNRAIAFTYGRERNHAEALKYLDLAIAAKPTDTMLLQLAAASAMETNDFTRAMGYAGKIDDTLLTESSPLVNLGVNLLNKRQAAHATTIFDRAIARFPAEPESYYYRALSALQTQNTANAKADLEKFIALARPDAPELVQAKELLSKIK